MHDISAVGIKEIFDSLSEGVYVCDLERRITYWSKSAERITGWSADQVVGRQCFDNVLCHIDKDGHHRVHHSHLPRCIPRCWSWPHIWTRRASTHAIALSLQARRLANC